MKPRPKATPTMPKLAARLSGGLTSAMYAPAGVNVAPPMPAMTRPTTSHHTLVAKLSRT
jgi:hypothetical protein